MNIKYFKKIKSTNNVAKRFNEPWLIILSNEQEQGHGKEGSHWFSPKGGLYFSVILPKADLKDIETITILGAFIVSKAIKKEFNLKTFIKPPNDVYFNNKKICGILTENIIARNNVKYSVMGIGLNTNTDNFPKDLNATSLKIELKREVDNAIILNLIVNELKKQFK